MLEVARNSFTGSGYASVSREKRCIGCVCSSQPSQRVAKPLDNSGQKQKELNLIFASIHRKRSP